FNIGYTAARGMVAGSLLGLSPARVPDEFNYTGGIEFVASPRITLIGDFVGRTLRDTGRLDVVSKNFQYASVDALSASAPPAAAFGGTAGPDCGTVPGLSGYTCKSIFLKEFAPRSGNLTLPLATGGIKYNVYGNMLVGGSVLFPLSTAGLRSRVTAVA